MNRLLLQLPAVLSCRLYLVYLRYTSMSLVPGLGQQDIADIPGVTFPGYDSEYYLGLLA